MVKVIQTGNKPINKAVKKFIRKNVLNVKGIFKRYIPGMGTVFFIKNNKEETVGHIYKDMSELVITIKEGAVI